MNEIAENGLSSSVRNLSDRLRGLRSGPQGLKEQDEARLRKVCQDFEAVFIGQIWKQMRSSVPKEGMLHSKEEESYLSMFDQELSLKMARSGGLGLADMLHANLSERLLDASKDTVSTAPMNPLQVPSASARTDSAVAAPDGRTVAAATAQHQAEMLARSIERAHNPGLGEKQDTAGDLEEALRMVRMDAGEEG